MRAIYRKENPRAEYHCQYEVGYRERRSELHKEKQATDPQYRLRRALRARLKNAIKKNSKSGSAVETLGCSIAEFLIYLESQFCHGMTWQNFGRLDASGLTWQIDHIRPLSSFDLTDDRQLREACHFTNLRPLWARDNRRKGNKVVSEKGGAICPTDGPQSLASGA